MVLLKSFIKMQSNWKHTQEGLVTQKKRNTMWSTRKEHCHINFVADFEFFNRIILEVKASDKGVAREHIAQTLNYIRVSGGKVGLIVNFGRQSLEYKRLIY